MKRGSQASEGIKCGDSSNEIGFGWTNAAFTELLALLPKEEQMRAFKVE